jgi:hypothetical protein
MVIDGKKRTDYSDEATQKLEQVVREMQLPYYHE